MEVMILGFAKDANVNATIKCFYVNIFNKYIFYIFRTFTSISPKSQKISTPLLVKHTCPKGVRCKCVCVLRKIIHNIGKDAAAYYAYDTSLLRTSRTSKRRGPVKTRIPKIREKSVTSFSIT